MTHSCTGTASSGPHSGTAKQDLFCADCVRVEGVQCKNGTCNLASATAHKVESISFSGGWRITEAFPPSSCSHGNSCHYDGTCIDAGFTGGTEYSAQNVNAFIRSVLNAGLSPVMEVTSVAACNALKDAGVNERYLDVVPQATAAHFSVYNRTLSAQPGCR